MRAPDDTVEALGRALPDGELELDLSADNVPMGLRLTVETPTASASLHFRFVEWDADVTIAPSTVPADWHLTSVLRIAADDTPEGCDQLDLTWEPIANALVAWDTGEYLDVYLIPTECAKAADRTVFRASEFGDVPTRRVGDLLELEYGTTVVQIDTTLGDDEVAAVVASLRAVDLDWLFAELAKSPEATRAF
jgi:hypothetical protein